MKLPADILTLAAKHGLTVVREAGAIEFRAHGKLLMKVTGSEAARKFVAMCELNPHITKQLVGRLA
jgi:hypothetical protein